MEILNDEPATKQPNQKKPVLPPINNDKILEYLPQSILATLTHRNKKYENLGPMKKPYPYKTKADNVWNHERSRAKLKHLTEQPLCICGAGRDISFLVDASSEKTVDNFSLSKPNILTKPWITESIIPKEYYVIKHKGTLGLEIFEDKYSTQAKNHEEHLTVFPSMNPAGRQEAAQLLKTMNKMLKKAGISERHGDLGIDGVETTSQIESLLKLVQDEQKIYNIVFNEIIRQVSVDCLERGKILAELRKHYASMLYRVPIHVKNLHDKILAIRALDKRLTEELIHFKSSITHLTKELHEVQAHDEEITCKAMETKEVLTEVLRDSQTNAHQLHEYHELYELQRHRMEYQLSKLIEERNLWTETAFMLSLKVIEKHKLVTLRRLHLFEEVWHKIISHIVKQLSQEDEKQMEFLIKHVNDWLKVGNLFDERLSQAEADSYSRIKRVSLQMKDWGLKFQVETEKGFQYFLDGMNIGELVNTLKSWESIFVNETERFSGVTLLQNEDDLLKMTACLDLMLEMSNELFGRHPVQDKQHSQQKTMVELKRKIKELHNHLSMRMCGENGIAKLLNNLMDTINTWIIKINGVTNGQLLFESEWMQFAWYLQVQWSDSISDLLNTLCATINNFKTDIEPENLPDEGSKSSESKNSQVMVVSKELEGWLNETVESTNKENSKTLDQVSATHLNMIRWAIIIILRTTPKVEPVKANFCEVVVADEKFSSNSVLLDESSSQVIIEHANVIFASLASLTDFINEVFKDGTSRKLVKDEDLKKIELESQGWIQTANLLIKELSEEPTQIDAFAQGQRMVVPSKITGKHYKSSDKSHQEKVAVHRIATENMQLNQTRDNSISELDTSDNVDFEISIINDNESLSRKSVNSFTEVLKTSSFKECTNVLAIEKLDSLEHLQTQLLNTEERAQKAEARALAAELSLKTSDEKIKNLERNNLKLSKLLVTKR